MHQFSQRLAFFSLAMLIVNLTTTSNLFAGRNTIAKSKKGSVVQRQRKQPLTQHINERKVEEAEEETMTAPFTYTSFSLPENRVATVEIIDKTVDVIHRYAINVFVKDIFTYTQNNTNILYNIGNWHSFYYGNTSKQIPSLTQRAHQNYTRKLKPFLEILLPDEFARKFPHIARELIVILINKVVNEFLALTEATLQQLGYHHHIANALFLMKHPDSEHLPHSVYLGPDAEISRFSLKSMQHLPPALKAKYEPFKQYNRDELIADLLSVQRGYRRESIASRTIQVDLDDINTYDFRIVGGVDYVLATSINFAATHCKANFFTDPGRFVTTT